MNGAIHNDGRWQELMTAIENNDREKVKALVNAGIDMNAEIDELKLHMFSTALKVNPEVFTNRAPGWDNITTTVGIWTPFTLAVVVVILTDADLEIIDIFLDAGADVNAKIGNGTVLDWAIKIGNQRLQEILEKRGAKRWEELQ